jgi:hypothetical protein
MKILGNIPHASWGGLSVGEMERDGIIHLLLYICKKMN